MSQGRVTPGRAGANVSLTVRCISASLTHVAFSDRCGRAHVAVRRLELHHESEDKNVSPGPQTGVAARVHQQRSLHGNPFEVINSKFHMRG